MQSGLNFSPFLSLLLELFVTKTSFFVALKLIRMATPYIFFASAATFSNRGHTITILFEVE